MKAFLKEARPESTYTVSYRVGEESFDVAFRTWISVDEESVFIRRVVDGCFDGNGDYRPEYFAPVFRATVLQMCTNLPPLTMKGDRDADGGNILDLDAMSALYNAIDPMHIDHREARDLIIELEGLCRKAVEWRKQRDLGIDAAVSETRTI